MRGGVFARLHRVLRFRKCHKGGILIEFTFSIPICIALLFFVNDHYRFYELKNKVRTSTYLIASMIQHVANTRSDKQLTKGDIGRIAYASCLNFFHTNTMFSPHPFGLYYVANIYYVKRVNGDNYQFQKSYGTTYSATTPSKMGKADDVSSKTLAQIEDIDKDLVCDKDGDERLLIECFYRKKQFNKNMLGLFVLDPPTNRSIDGMTNNVFINRLIITPKPGLFPVKESS